MSILFDHIYPQARHKLLFTSDEVHGIEYVDLGYLLSAALADTLESSRLSMMAEDKLKRIIADNVHSVDGSTDCYVAIKNIGILFEPALKLNIHSLFDSWASEYILIVHLEGRIENRIFRLSNTNDSRYQINLKDISYSNI